MNERLKELRRQATLVESYTTNDGTVAEGKHVDLEKFAELIVRECMDIAKRTGDNFGSANPDVLAGGQGAAFCVYQNIKNTFGVE